MSVTVGWTQADVDALRVALASGVRVVSYSGPPARTVEYQSSTEMLKVLAQAVSELANTAGTRAPFKRIASRKGV